jgi:hypothetical protein
VKGETEGSELKRVTCWFWMSSIDRTKVRSIAFLQECVCDVGLCTRTNVSEFDRKPESAIKRIVVRSITRYKNKTLKINKTNKFIQTTNKKNKQ